MWIPFGPVELPPVQFVAFSPIEAAAVHQAKHRKSVDVNAKQLFEPIKSDALLSQADPSQNRFPQTGPLQESLPPRPLEPEEEPTPDAMPEGPAPSPEPEPDVPELLLEGVEIQQIIVTGSTVFREEELQQVLPPYRERLLSVEDLQKAANAITQLYISRGYITSRAVLPEQTLVDGVVEIQVIEGHLEAIQIVGAERMADYIRSRVGLGVGQPLNQRDLEDQLRLLQIDPLFDRINGILRPGSTPGGTLLVVEAEAAEPFSGSIGIDTLSPRSVGQYRTGATLQLRNLAGLGDTLFTSAYRTTTGGSEVYELGYRIPLNPMNGTLQFRITPNFFRVTDPNEPGFELDQRGSTDIYEVGFRQPLVRTPREELALSLDFRYRQGSTLIAGQVQPTTRTSVFSFGQDYTRRDFSGAWAARSQFRLGTGLFDATTRSGSEADGQFFSWLGQLQRVQVLSPDNLLIVSADVQLTPDRLLGSERLFIGGGLSVRGYYQNARFGDNGVRFSVEDRITLVRDKDDGRVLLQANPFVDLGYVWNNDNANFFDRNFLIGTGIGFILNPLPNLSTKIDFGLPLVALDEIPSDSPSGLRVYFDVRYRF